MKELVKKHYFASVATIATMLGLILLALGLLFVHQFENGIIEVCADQQDAYVQLVLDQIYIKDNRDDASIIEEILGTLDASTNKYWTFSKNEAMLFVKDVTETNKYKGFTTRTYYISESAQKFLDELMLNHVTHRQISIEQKNYVASGVIFEYGENTYRLCLLTNKDVFLDNNSFLGSEINLVICYALSVLIMVVEAMIFAHRIGQEKKESTEREKVITGLNASINKLNDKLLVKNTYDMQRTLFQESILDDFLDRIQGKGITPVTFALFNCANEEEFLAKAQLMLDRSVIRFRLSGDRAYEDANVAGQILLVFLRSERAQTYERLRPIIGINVTLRSVEMWTPEYGDIHEYVRVLRERNV
ncbi:MAG: hypothetical protein K5686_02350 [Lachnospiraceae bacterium]|nr:hypothetical protein [Lachnospiraceae bacterium]